MWSPALQADEGRLILAGAAGDPVEGALFVFKNVSQEVGGTSTHRTFPLQQQRHHQAQPHRPDSA
jgi:hypothetical protein